MSQESNLRYLDLSHLINDHPALKAAIEQRVVDVESGRLRVDDVALYVARCRKELHRLERWPEIEKEREFYRSMKGGHIISITFDGKQVYPHREECGPMSFSELIDVAHRPMTNEQRFDAFEALNREVFRGLLFEQIYVDVNTGLMNRRLWDEHPVIGNVLVVDLEPMIRFLDTTEYSRLGDAVADVAGRALYEAMHYTRQSVKAYRLARTRFGVQCLDPSQRETVVARLQETLTKARICQCFDGRYYEIRGVTPRFAYGDSYESAVRQLSEEQ